MSSDAHTSKFLWSQIPQHAWLQSETTKLKQHYIKFWCHPRKIQKRRDQHIHNNQKFTYKSAMGASSQPRVWKTRRSPAPRRATRISHTPIPPYARPLPWRPLTSYPACIKTNTNSTKKGGKCKKQRENTINTENPELKEVTIWAKKWIIATCFTATDWWDRNNMIMKFS